MKPLSLSPLLIFIISHRGQGAHLFREHKKAYFLPSKSSPCLASSHFSNQANVLLPNNLFDPTLWVYPSLSHAFFSYLMHPLVFHCPWMKFKFICISSIPFLFFLPISSQSSHLLKFLPFSKREINKQKKRYLQLWIFVVTHFPQGWGGSSLTQESMKKCFYIMYASLESSMPLSRIINTRKISRIFTSYFPKCSHSTQHSALSILCVQYDGGHSFSVSEYRTYSQGLHFKFYIYLDMIYIEIWFI